MDGQLGLQQLEQLCAALYTAQDPETRRQAEAKLAPLGQSTEYVAFCKAILDSSEQPYAQLFASATLMKLVTEHSVSSAVRMDMKTYFMGFLSSKVSSLQPFVMANMVQLLCRTIKLGWFDSDANKSLPEDCKALLEGGSSAHYHMGLKILNTLVAEMNQPGSSRTLTQHRKIAVNFRDSCLLKIFQMALAACKQLLQQQAGAALQQEALALAQACLNFDFVGTCLDDTTEDVTTIQVPTTWRSIVEEPSTLQLFYDYYKVSQPPISNAALECLVRLASVRRSLFSSESERAKFLNRLVGGTREIMSSQQGLAHHDNYHELCRLLGRLKSNYQLNELVAVDQYTEWIQLLAQLTTRSLGSWQWASDSIFYLLGLWGRLVSSQPYLKGDAPSLLDTNVPQIMQAYITSRLEAVCSALQAGTLDELLQSEETLADQLDSLPFLCRFQYEQASRYLAGQLDPLLERYKACAAMPAADIDAVEAQLAWLVFLVGAIIKGRLSSSSAESQEAIDGDLSSRVFMLLSCCDEGLHARRYEECSRQRLDSAVINFFQAFRRVYIGEQVMHSSKVYTKLQERLGLSDHLAVLNVMLTKIATNLKVYGKAEDLVHATLNLFQDLASGYMSGKLLLKLDATSFILANHTSAQFTFLDHPSNSRNRTLFYSTLARLLFMEDTPARFKAFITPLQQVLVGIAQAKGLPGGVRQSVPAATVTGLFRDLRGVAAATNSRRTYCLVFDWLYPQHFPTVIACLEAFSDMEEVTTPLLKFMAEFSFNKSQRLTFDSSSPNGILLFREVSKVIVAYGSATLGRPAVPEGHLYDLRYKGVWICLSMLARAMSGNYVNFGVFELYGDRALKSALDTALAMVLAVPLADILAYKKMSKAYFSLLEVLCHGHISTIVSQDGATFSTIMTSLEQGVKSIDVAISSSCASAIDNLAAFYFKNVVCAADVPTPQAGAQQLAEHIRAQPSIFPEMLKTLFEVVLFEECSNQWSLSRPMLSLILIMEQHYAALRQQIISSQAADRQAHLASCLDKLMVDVQRNLEAKNRDKFTQNLTIVRHDYRSKS